MQRFHQKNLIWLASAVVIYLLLQVLVQVGVINFYYESTFINIMINIIFAVGLNLILGVAGQFSLGHAGFIAIGAYSAAIIGKAVSGLAGLFAGMAVGVVISIVIAYLVGLPTLRLKGDYLAIATLGVAMGGEQSTFYGLTGLGDLIVTCASMHSRNRRAGILLGQGKTLDEAIKEVNMVVEGVYSAKSALMAARKYNVEIPIIEQVNAVLFENKNAAEAVNELMIRDKKLEIQSW